MAKISGCWAKEASLRQGKPVFAKFCPDKPVSPSGVFKNWIWQDNQAS
jgi:hypothetical protein